MAYSATKKPVRGSAPPDSFLDELVAWGQSARDDIFAPNSASNDIYANVFAELGPWRGVDHRRAVMLEVMRVLAGFESTWNWNQGPDPKSKTPETKEAGAWQVSADSMDLGAELKNLVLTKTGSVDANDFQVSMKQNHPLAMEYIARLLRRTVDANGPAKRHEINSSLRKDAATEFQHLLRPVGDYPPPSPRIRGMA